MELFQLRYFLAAAKYESVSKAAKAEYVSQSAVSRAIRSLEKELSTQLFTRRDGILKLNTEGLLLKERAIEALAVLGRAEKELGSFHDAARQIIRIKLLCGYGKLPEHVKSFSKLNPEVGFHFLAGDSDAPYDLVIDSVHGKSVPGNAVILHEDYMKVVVPADSELAKKEKVWLKEFDKVPFISTERGHFLRSLFDKLCEQVEFVPNIAQICYDVDIMQTMLRSGGVCGIWPASSEKNLQSSACVVLELCDQQQPWTIFLQYGSKGSQSEMVKQFVEYILHDLHHSIMDENE